MSLYGFRIEEEAEARVEGGCFGEEPFQFLHRGRLPVLVREMDMEVAYHPWHTVVTIELLLLGQCLHDFGTHRRVPELILVDTIQIRL